MMVSLFSGFLSLTSNLTTQPCQIRKTSKSTTRKPMLSKLTTGQAPTSKSLYHLKYHASGLVPMNEYLYDFTHRIFILKSQKSLISSLFQTLTLLPLLSIPRTQHALYVITYQYTSTLI